VKSKGPGEKTETGRAQQSCSSGGPAPEQRTGRQGGPCPSIESGQENKKSGAMGHTGLSTGHVHSAHDGKEGTTFLLSRKREKTTQEGRRVRKGAAFRGHSVARGHQGQKGGKGVSETE